MRLRLVAVLAGLSLPLGAYGRAPAPGGAASVAPRPASVSKQAMGRSPLPPWATFAPGEGNFSVEMPGAPVLQQQTEVTAAGPIQVSLYADPLLGGTLMYTVSFSDYPEAVIRRTRPQNVLDSVRNGAVANAHGSLVNEQRITIGSYPGRDLMVNIPAQTAILHARIYLVGNRVYQVGMFARSSSRTPDDEQRFFNSFRLNGVATPPPAPPRPRRRH